MDKTKKIFAKISIIIFVIFTLLSILIFVGGLSIGIPMMQESLTMKGIEFFGPIPNLFMFAGGFAMIIYSIIIIGILWLIYAIILGLYYCYHRINPRYKNYFWITLIVIFLSIYGLVIGINDYRQKNKDLLEVLNNVPSYVDYENTDYYFIHNDKIYYYNFTNSRDRLYVMDLDGTNNKLLRESDELRFAHFNFVYKDEAYYYTTYYSTNKKIDLKTGVISDTNVNDYFISKTLSGDTVNTYSERNSDDNNYFELNKIDLNKNTNIYSNRINEGFSGNDYFIDYRNGDIYYTHLLDSDDCAVYRNNKMIYDFEQKLKLLFKKDNYLYMYNDSTIYKLNLNTNKTEKTINYNIKNLSRISSGNDTDNYFYGGRAIYTYDDTNDRFEIFIDDISSNMEYIYNYGNNIIFTENTDNVDYLGDTSKLGNAIIYNKTSKKTESYDNVRKTSFDENCLYLIQETNKKYKVVKVNI